MFGKILSLVVAALLTTASTAYALMPVIQSDRVVLGAEFVPRYLDLPLVKVVAPGEIWEPGEDETWDYIEIQNGGTLHISRYHDTTLRFTHLFILPGGYLNAGFDDPILGNNCIPADVKVTFIVRNVPINFARDPFQWGNGILNFGKQDRCGATKLTWSTATSSLTAGTTTITLSEDPTGWRIGDEVLIPDMLPSRRRESKVLITAIDGRQLTLSKPLNFDHNIITKPDGSPVLLPRVANLTRNVVVRSENPSGTKGHTADIGHHAIWKVRYNAIEGMGRTCNQALNDTNLTTGHIGTCQRGKYATHGHHNESSPSSAYVGNVIRGPGSKWGMALHSTSDVLVERNIAIDFPGAGFVTEDGPEVRNIFRGNFAAYAAGGGTVDSGSTTGTTGMGFWFRGTRNIVTGNEAWNNVRGINLFATGQVLGLYPSVPGGPLDTTFTRSTATPISFSDNITAANTIGLEYWGVPRFPARRLISANNSVVQVNVAIAAPAEPYLIDPLLVTPDGSSARGIESNLAYTNALDVEGGYIGGCAAALGGGGAHVRVTFIRTVLQCAANLWWSNTPDLLRIKDVMFLPLGSRSPNYISFGTNAIWVPGTALPSVGLSQWVPQQGSKATIENWQGTGKNYQLFHKQQLASNPAWPSTLSGPHRFNCPEVVSMGVCWAKFGMGYKGDVVNDVEAVNLPGLIRGVAREGLTTVLSPPRAIVTSPTLRDNSAALIVNGKLTLQLLATGQWNTIYTHFKVVIDDVESKLVIPSAQYGNPYTTTVSTTRIAPGVHTVRTYRATAAGTVLVGSEMTFQYIIL